MSTFQPVQPTLKAATSLHHNGTSVHSTKGVPTFDETPDKTRHYRHHHQPSASSSNGSPRRITKIRQQDMTNHSPIIPHSSSGTSQRTRKHLRMEDLEVDGRLKRGLIYARPSPIPAKPEGNHRDSFLLPAEFFQWHGDVIVDHQLDELMDIVEPSEPSKGNIKLSIPDTPKDRNPCNRKWMSWQTRIESNAPCFNPQSEADRLNLLVSQTEEWIECVDPWDVALNQDPPFYRREMSSPPYISGTTTIDTRMRAKIPNSWWLN